MGSIFKLGANVAVAFSVFIPDKTAFHEISAFPNQKHYMTYSLDDQQLWLGPSVGGNITPKLSAGISVFGVYRTYSEFESIYWAKDPETLSLSQDMKTYTINLVSIVGVQLHPTDRWNVGLTFQTPQFSIMENGEVQYQYVKQYQDSGSFFADDLTIKNDVPMKLAVGLGQEEKNVYAWGIDIS